MPRPSIPADPMAPVGQVPAAQFNSKGEPSGAEISDQLASARITARKLAMRRQKGQRVIIASMLITLVVVAGLGIGYVTGVIRFGPELTVSKSNGEGSHDVPVDGATPQGVGKATTDATPKSQAEPRAKLVPAKEAPVKPLELPLDPAQMARFKAELQAARKALGERQFQQAKERIDSAKQLAESEQQNQHVEGFQALSTYVEGFWGAVREGLKGLETAGELRIGKTVVSVVEVTSEHLIIREAGKNQRYSVDQLPARLAVAIAQHWYDDRPDNKLYLGAFHFVGPPTDVAEAKRLWEEAASAGIEVDRLLGLLEM